jgi:hypothetical protein
VSDLQLPKVFAKDLSNLFTLVAWATDMQRHGSYSDRHPNLGKMRRCPHCGIRRREFGPRCCNAEFSTTTDVVVSKSVIKRLMKKKHGQTRAFKIRELTKRMQKDELLRGRACFQMHLKMPGIADIPSFAEKFFYWLEERQAKKIRRQQDHSRRINVGLCS